MFFVVKPGVNTFNSRNMQLKLHVCPINLRPDTRGNCVKWLKASHSSSLNITNDARGFPLQLPKSIQKTSGASWPWCRHSVYPAPALCLETLYHRAAAVSREPSLCLQRHSASVLKSGFRTEQNNIERIGALLLPVFPMIFSQGWSVRMLSSRGEMRGVRDHSLTVLSLLQLAMVNGRLWWQVKPTHTHVQLGKHSAW